MRPRSTSATGRRSSRTTVARRVVGVASVAAARCPEQVGLRVPLWILRQALPQGVRFAGARVRDACVAQRDAPSVPRRRRCVLGVRFSLGVRSWLRPHACDMARPIWSPHHNFKASGRIDIGSRALRREAQSSSTREARDPVVGRLPPPIPPERLPSFAEGYLRSSSHPALATTSGQKSAQRPQQRYPQPLCPLASERLGRSRRLGPPRKTDSRGRGIGRGHPRCRSDSANRPPTLKQIPHPRPVGHDAGGQGSRTPHRSQVLCSGWLLPGAGFWRVTAVMAAPAWCAEGRGCARRAGGRR